MTYTQENIQFSESVVKYNLINFLNFLIYMGSLSGAGRCCGIHRPFKFNWSFPKCWLHRRHM